LRIMTDDFKYTHTYDGFDIVAEVIAAILLIGQAIFIYFSLSILPDIIPNHFNGDGIPNGHGSKYTICGPFLFSVILFVALTVLSRYPHLYKSRMQKNNRTAEYKLGVKVILTLKPILMSVFFLITYFMIQTAQLKLTAYLNYLLGAILLIIFCHVIYWLIRFTKLN